jgi:hypothetical protein
MYLGLVIFSFKIPYIYSTVAIAITNASSTPPPPEAEIVNVFPDGVIEILVPATKFTAPVLPLTEVTDPPPPAGVAHVIPLPVEVKT